MKENHFGICTINAPCKINLHLAVGQKRPDGFHALNSLFATLAFNDTLRLECLGQDGEDSLFVNQEAPGETLVKENNLVLKAVSLFRERTGFKTALKIRLDKRIPIGAGLGGGSSDAASTLLALNLLAGTSLSADDLAKMAALLGSDAPFFVTGGTAFVGGRGELIESVKIPFGLWVILVCPPFSSSTVAAYRQLDWIRERKEDYLGEDYQREALSKETIILALEEDCRTWPFFNDFLPVFLNSPQCGKDEATAYRSIFAVLQNFGASFAGLSGAGSACFGLFHEKDRAERCAIELDAGGNFARTTFFLAHKGDPVLE